MDAILVCIGLFVNIYFLTDLNVQTPGRFLKAVYEMLAKAIRAYLKSTLQGPSA
jgi:hypothetical protein